MGGHSQHSNEAGRVGSYAKLHNVMPDNPFTFGDLALDDAFTDREEQVKELVSDMRNGQNVLVYAPAALWQVVLGHACRAGSSAAQGARRLLRSDAHPDQGALRRGAGEDDLRGHRLAGGQALERASSLFRSLRVVPTIEVDPADASLRFTFQTARRRADIDETIERLLELPAELAVERKRRAVLVFDEFQEVLTLDRHFPNLMRAVFQAQPEVGHVYLGSRRHVLERIFSDRNEPFWRAPNGWRSG